MWIIDRFEGDLAVLEKANGSQETAIVPIKKLPKGSREGDVLKREGEFFLRGQEEIEEHARRAERIRAKMERLKK